jgi:HK97 family phage major capsid protein
MGRARGARSAPIVTPRPYELIPGIRQLAVFCLGSNFGAVSHAASAPRLVDEVEPVPVAETAARTEDEPTFDQIDLKPFEMAIIVPVTRILLEDAQIDLTGYLSNHVARRFGQKEATWFVNGNSITQAEGVFTSTAVAAHEVDAITGDDLIDLFYSIKTA